MNGRHKKLVKNKKNQLNEVKINKKNKNKNKKITKLEIKIVIKFYSFFREITNNWPDMAQPMHSSITFEIPQMRGLYAVMKI